MNKSIALLLGSMMLVSCSTSHPDGDTSSVGSSQWRVVVDDHQVGGPIDPGIRTATDDDTFDTLWALLGRDGDQPSVDFNEVVIVAYTASYSSGCEFPFIGLVIDESDAVITADYAGNEPGPCSADENQYLVMIGIDRDALQRPRYELTTSAAGQTATLDL